MGSPLNPGRERYDERLRQRREAAANTVRWVENYEDQMLTGWFGGGKGIQGPLLVALTTEDGQEVSGAGYARQQISFAPASHGHTGNDAPITFPPAQGEWGQVAGCLIIDAGNQPVLESKLSSSKKIVEGDVLHFDTDAINISLF